MESKPERHGKPWLSDEEENALQMIKAGKSKEEIAFDFKRTIGGIHSHLRQMACQFILNGMSLEDACEKCDVSQIEMQDYMRVREYAEKERRRQVIVKEALGSVDDKTLLLKTVLEIRDLLKQLVENK